VADIDRVDAEVRRLRADMNRLDAADGETDMSGESVDPWGDDGVTIPHVDYEVVATFHDIDDIKAEAETALENWERYPALFDLYDKTATTIKVRGKAYGDGPVIDLNDSSPFDFNTDALTTGDNGPLIVQVAGVHTKVLPLQGAGAPTPNGTAVFDAAMTITANEIFYLYFKTDLTVNPAVTKCYFHRSSTASTAGADHVYADGGDFSSDTESRLFVPLWWVEFAAGAITRILDMRTMPRFDRAGN